jgi:hypothetical protein
MHKEVSEAVEGTPAKDLPANEEAVKAEVEATSAERVQRVNFIVDESGCL